MIPRWDGWESRGVTHLSVLDLDVEQSGSQKAFAARAVVTDKSKSLCCGTTLQLAHTFFVSSVSVWCAFMQTCSCWQSQEMPCLSWSQSSSSSQRQAGWTRVPGLPVGGHQETCVPSANWPTFLHLGWPARPPCSYHKFGLGYIPVFIFFSLKCSVFCFLNGYWWKPLVFLVFLSMNWSDDNRVSSKL